MNAPQRILVHLPNPLGDAIMATPALRTLRDAFPHAQITLLGKAAPLLALADGPLADHSIRIGGFLATARLLRQGGPYDLAIVFPNSFRSALLVRIARARRRVGYARDGRGWLLTDPISRPRNASGKPTVPPAIEYYNAVIRSLGLEAAGSRMELHADAALAASLLQEAGFEAGRPLVMLNPGGAFGPSKLWPADRYAALADVLTDRHGAQVIVHAAPGERETAAAVVQAMRTPPLLDFSRRDGSIPLLKSLLARCDLLVTNDTGARHVAAAVGCAIVTIFGSTDPDRTTLDYSAERIVRVDVPCGPCQQKACPLPAGSDYHQCMTTISVEQVCAAAEELLTSREVRQ